MSDKNNVFYVYIHQDRHENVLYVGYTSNMRERTDQHKYSSPWFGDVTSVKYEEYPCEKSARERERNLIRCISPRYNRAGVAGDFKIFPISSSISISVSQDLISEYNSAFKESGVRSEKSFLSMLLTLGLRKLKEQSANGKRK